MASSLHTWMMASSLHTWMMAPSLHTWTIASMTQWGPRSEERKRWVWRHDGSPWEAQSQSCTVTVPEAGQKKVVKTDLTGTWDRATVPVMYSNSTWSRTEKRQSAMNSYSGKNRPHRNLRQSHSPSHVQYLKQDRKKTISNEQLQW